VKTIDPYEEMTESISFLEDLGLTAEEKAKLYHHTAANLGFA
jgi:hypothetical protein